MVKNSFPIEGIKSVPHPIVIVLSTKFNHITIETEAIYRLNILQTSDRILLRLKGKPGKVQ